MEWCGQSRQFAISPVLATISSIHPHWRAAERVESARTRLAKRHKWQVRWETYSAGFRLEKKSVLHSREGWIRAPRCIGCANMEQFHTHTRPISDSPTNPIT